MTLPLGPARPLASAEIQRHKDAVAVDSVPLPVAPAPPFDLKAKPFVEGAGRLVVVENRGLGALKPSLTRPVQRQGEKAHAEPLAAMACDQAHAEASDMRTDRGGIRGNVSPADHRAIDRHDLRGIGLAQAGDERRVALDRRRAQP